MLKRRKNIRLKGYDYSKEGLYFITICCNEYMCLFGNIEDDEIVLNDAGRTVEKWWRRIPQKFKDIELDYSEVMPNHFHGVIAIVGADPCVCPNKKKMGEHMGSPLQTEDEIVIRRRRW